MKLYQPSLSIVMACIAVFLVSGCYHHRTAGPAGHVPPKSKTYQTSHHSSGPPAHAPAHGYRYKHRDGRDMRYDAGLSAYIVLNVPETYFFNNLYLRLGSDGLWMVSASIGNYWRPARQNEVPQKLREYRTHRPEGKKKKEKSKHNKHWKKDKYED